MGDVKKGAPAQTLHFARLGIDLKLCAALLVQGNFDLMIVHGFSK